MRSLLNCKVRIMSLCTHNDNNNIHDLSKTSVFRNNSSFRTNPISSFALCLGKNIGNSILKHKKSLATAAAAFALPFIFTNNARAVEGNVSISYHVNSIGGSTWHFGHTDGAKEGLDNWDHILNRPPDPSGFDVIAVSYVDGYELTGDARPAEDPPSSGSCSLSIVGDFVIPEGTSHWIDVSVSGYEGYKVYVNGENMTSGGTINFGDIPAGTYPGGLSTGSASVSFESIITPPTITSPTVSTKSATSIGKTSATLEGYLDNDGYEEGDESCDYKFSYWMSGASAGTTGWSGSIYEGDTFSTSVSGLTPDTMYYFVAEARNSAGESSGGTNSFQTLSSGSVEPNEPEESQLKNILNIKHQEGQSSRMWRLVSGETASNTLDENDQLYFSENGPKIISLISEDPNNQEMHELKLDARKTLDDTILLEASSVSSGEAKILTSANKLQLSLEDPNSTITIQPYDPNFPVELAYDISTLTNNGANSETIELFDPNNPERTHAFFILNPNSRTAHWTFDEPSGNAAEDKINDHHGVVHGNPNRESGKVGGALSLDGIDDYISTPFVLNPSDGAFSAYAWVKGPAGPIIYQQNGQSWLETSLDGKLATGLNDNFSTNLQSQGTITDSEWHRVGVVWDGSKRYLYLDGEQAAKDTENINNLQSSQGELYLGRNAERFLNASIDDVIIYNLPVRDTPQKEAPEANNFEGFESGGFGKFNWGPHEYDTRIGQWIVTSESPYSGNFCAKGFNDSDVIGNTYIASEKLNCKDGKISGWVKVNTDYRRGLTLFMDTPAGDNHVAHWGGEGEEQDWQYFSYPISAGNHKVIFRFTKLVPEAMGEYAYVDNITFPLKD